VGPRAVLDAVVKRKKEAAVYKNYVYRAEAGNFSLLHRVQTGSGAHPAPYPGGTRGSFPGCETDHSFPSSAEVKNAWRFTSIPNTSSWRSA
jgi:hypothetical protein